jgi:hypothetical protein
LRSPAAPWSSRRRLPARPSRYPTLSYCNNPCRQISSKTPARSHSWNRALRRGASAVGHHTQHVNPALDGVELKHRLASRTIGREPRPSLVAARPGREARAGRSQRRIAARSAKGEGDATAMAVVCGLIERLVVEDATGLAGGGARGDRADQRRRPKSGRCRVRPRFLGLQAEYPTGAPPLHPRHLRRWQLLSHWPQLVELERRKGRGLRDRAPERLQAVLRGGALPPLPRDRPAVPARHVQVEVARVYTAVLAVPRDQATRAGTLRDSELPLLLIACSPAKPGREPLPLSFREALRGVVCCGRDRGARLPAQQRRSAPAFAQTAALTPRWSRLRGPGSLSSQTASPSSSGQRYWIPLRERARAALPPLEPSLVTSPKPPAPTCVTARARPASLRLRARGEREREHRAESQNPS